MTCLVVLAGCSPRDPSSSPVAAAPSGNPEIAAIIDGQTITLGEVDEHLKEQFIREFQQQPEQRIFEMRETAIRDMVQKHVVATEADRLGVTSAEVYTSIEDGIAEPTDEDIAHWYSTHQGRVQGAPLDDVSPAIREMLEKERRTEAMSAFLEPKLAALAWEMVISPPRKELETTRLVRGAADAPVTIIAFSDYQCPYCVRAEPVLAEVLERYPEEVKIVHRHFPLDSIHPFARPAAEAAMCADEQGRFWAYHDGIFARHGQLSESSIGEIGAAVGLDATAFDTCVEERRYKDFVENDFAAGREAGVTGTPSFFLNGIALKGARDADELSRYIDLELTRLKPN
jgi:predicted DsbA family dithiol-disulfide isomerase